MRSLYAPPEPPEDPEECPQCGWPVDVNATERTADCSNPDCDYHSHFDWDAEAEAREEARADRAGDRYAY